MQRLHIQYFVGCWNGINTKYLTCLAGTLCLLHSVKVSTAAFVSLSVQALMLPVLAISDDTNCTARDRHCTWG